MTTNQTEISLSILIPNFNYARYIGETIDSVLDQGAQSVEIVVCDNASTDGSVELLKRYQDRRVRLSVNPTNIGFSANLERVAGLARGRRMLLLSSDDRMRAGALTAYDKLEQALGPAADNAIWGSATTIIDSAGSVSGHLEPDPKLWREARSEPELTHTVGFPVRSLPAAQLLRRSLELLRTPLPFATTCYPRALHDQVGGYSGGRLMNPDKWFLWKLLAVAETVYVIDEPLFDYRVHESRQVALEHQSGALKHLTDQYITTFMLPESVLERAGIERLTVAKAFVEQDVVLRGLVSLSEGKRVLARRGLHLGLAAYPNLVRTNPKILLLRSLLALGPVGTALARLARARVEERWNKRESHSTATRPEAHPA